MRSHLTALQPAAGEKTQGTGTSIFDKTGPVGSMFNGMLHYIADHLSIEAHSRKYDADQLF